MFHSTAYCINRNTRKILEIDVWKACSVFLALLSQPNDIHFFIKKKLLFLAVSCDRVFLGDSKIANAITNYLFFMSIKYHFV